MTMNMLLAQGEHPIGSRANFNFLMKIAQLL